MSGPSFCITIPVYNEERGLESSIKSIVDFLASRRLAQFQIIIADNASTDSTLSVAHRIENLFPFVRVIHLAAKGRGGAIKSAWSANACPVQIYMDVDLSTDLAHLPEIIHAIHSGSHDLAIGSRLLHPESTTRGLKREAVSRCYNWLLKRCFQTRFSDAQCGFKAISNSAARALLPLVEDNEWFFDTELVIIAEKLGFRILDLPVRWVDDPDSRVKIVPAALQDLRGILRLKRTLPHISRNGPPSNKWGGNLCGEKTL